MGNVLLVLLVWIVAIAGIRIMKKLEPDNRGYRVWAIMICIILTLFVGWYESWGQELQEFLQLHLFH